MLLVTGLDRSVNPATQQPYPAPVIDPQKKARDADRDAAIEVVEAAYADGQISRPDYDLRVDRLLRATTFGELQMLIQDLRLPEGEHVTEAVEVVTALDEESPSASRPGPNLSAAKIVLVSAAAVLALVFAAAWAVSPRLRAWIEQPKHRFQDALTDYDRGEPQRRRSTS